MTSIQSASKDLDPLLLLDPSAESEAEKAETPGVPAPASTPSSKFGGKNAAARDRLDQYKDKPAVADYLRHAHQKSGRRPFELLREYVRLRRGRGRLSWPEYVQYGVYDTTRYDPENQARFITNNLHWRVTRVCCDMTWQATTEDTWLNTRFLDQTSVRMPEILAVIDKTDRAYPGTRKIATADELRAFLTAQDGRPVFGKENRGICSFGAFLAQGADATRVHLEGREPMAFDAFMDEFVGETSYVLQPVQRNHGFFDRYTRHLATVRVCILLADGGVKIPFAVLKLPGGGNVADSFWRPGNLACNLDVGTGEILTVRSKDALGTTDHTGHPETGAPMLGETVPMWDQVLDLAKSCAPIFQPVRYQSMDIAITEDGPVLIEINTGGGFDLPQLASGEGFLTDDVREFFRSCGYKRV